MNEKEHIVSGRIVRADELKEFLNEHGNNLPVNIVIRVGDEQYSAPLTGMVREKSVNRLDYGQDDPEPTIELSYIGIKSEPISTSFNANFKKKKDGKTR